MKPKFILLNMPYILVGLFATNLGQAWRMTLNVDASKRFLVLLSALQIAFNNPLPSLYPFDILVGIICGAGLRLAVYLKSKNAKKYRQGVEYGSARCGA